MIAARSIILSLAALASIGATAASADEVDRRQAHQEYRIQQGVRTGEINRWEYMRLEAEQARIRDMERRARADGRIDPYEAAQLRHAQNAASRHIYQESHDRQYRGSWYRRWW